MTTAGRPGRLRRLRGFDYAGCGEYFVTTVTHRRECLFGTVVGSVMRRTSAGDAVHRAWLALPERYPFLSPDSFIVMPNHIHGILVFGPEHVLARDGGLLTPGRVHLDRVMRAFKSTSAIAVNRTLGRAGVPLWQSGYFEHVVRNERALERIRGYIDGNPEAWPKDRFHSG